MDYISNEDDTIRSNLILNTMAATFPINRYVASARNITNNNYIEEDHDSIKFAEETNLLFNNDLYVDLIMKGIENYNKKSSSNKSINETQNLEVEIDGAQTTNKNGSVFNSLMPIDIISGEVYLEYEGTTHPEAKETLGSINGEFFSLKQLLDRNFLYNNFYIIDSATTRNDELFDAEELLGKDMTLKTTSDKPQILVYHTHSQEAFIDSREGVEDDTVVGLGTYLTELLTDKYGYNVIHDKSQYDIMSGHLDRNLAYNYACDGIEKILAKNPSIEVVIDVHRDGADKRVTKINGKNTAQIMLFNGLSRNSKGKISYLENPYLQDNLAFSLQLQLKGREKFPGLMYKNYLHAYRYNMHLRKKSLLVETGTDENTVKEVMNSMEYLADILNEVISEN
jgi:stage II sporulation protein P